MIKIERVIHVAKENEYVNRVSAVRNILLRGRDNYEDFLSLLRNLQPPTDEDRFFIFFVKNLYIEEDFYAMHVLIEKNIQEYDERTAGKVWERLSREILRDYLDYLGNED